MGKKGKFIVIEGLDGSGATTQINLLVGYLRKKGIKAFETKEPTDNVIGGLVRGALTGVYQLPEVTLQLLFSADRGHHLQRMIEPAIKKRAYVVCDRYFWSTIAFGSVSLDKKWLLEMQKYFLFPDLTLILKVSPEECIRRISNNRYDYELFEEENKLKKVWKTYLWLSKKYPERIKIIDGHGNIDVVFSRVVESFEKYFKT